MRLSVALGEAAHVEAARAAGVGADGASGAANLDLRDVPGPRADGRVSSAQHHVSLPAVAGVDRVAPHVANGQLDRRAIASAHVHRAQIPDGVNASSQSHPGTCSSCRSAVRSSPSR